MSGYFLAPAAVQLRNEVNKQFPNRDKRSDGWIGDPSHAARESEHNPCWSCSGRFYGIVLAIDIDVDDGDRGRDLRKELLNELIGDPRVWYVISNGIIYSRTYGFRARRYTGSNGHFAHLHVSFLKDRAFDTRPFFGASKPKRKKPPTLDLNKVRAEYLRVVKGGEPRYSIDVLRSQRLLNSHGHKLKVDGYAGPSTLNAWGKQEGRVGGEGRHRVPDKESIRKLNRGMFRLVNA